MLSKVCVAFVACACANAQKTKVTIGGAPGKYGEIAFKLWESEIANVAEMADVEVTMDLIPDGDNWAADYTAKMDNWDIVIAPYTSKKSGETVDLVNGTKPVMVWGGAAESIFKKGMAGVFGTFTPAGHYFHAGIEELNDKMGTDAAKTVEFIENDSPFSAAVCAGAIAKADELGWTHAIADATMYTRGSSNAEIKDVLAPVVTANPDIIVVCGHEEDTVQVVHQMAEDQLCPKALLCTNCLNNPSAWSGDDEALKDHLIMPTQWSQMGAAPGTDGVFAWTKEEFVTKFKAEASNTANQDPTYHQASAMLSALAIAEALKGMNGADYDQAAFITAMEGLDMKTFVGEFKPSKGMSANADGMVGANWEKPMVTEQLQPSSSKADKLEIVAPSGVATSPLEYPRSACLEDGTKTTVTIGGALGKYGETAFKLWASEIESLDSMSKVKVNLVTVADDDNWKATYESQMADWDIVIAPYTSKKSGETVDLVNGAKPVIVWGGAAESIFKKGKAGVFGTFTPAGHYFHAGIEELNAKMGTDAAKTVEFIENDSPFSAAVCAGAIAKADALGWTHAIADATTYTRGSSNDEIKAVLAPVVTANPDIIVVCGHEEDTVQVVHQMAEEKLCPKALMCTNCLNNPSAWSGDDEALKDHLIMPTQWSQLGAASGTDGVFTWTKDEFVTKFKADASNTENKDPTYHAASAFLSALAIAEALKGMDGAAYDQATFIDAMNALDMKTFVGEFKPSKGTSANADGMVGANWEKPMFTEQLQPSSSMDDKIEIVAPTSAATKALEYPRSACLDTASVDHATTSGISFGLLLVLAIAIFA